MDLFEENTHEAFDDGTTFRYGSDSWLELGVRAGCEPATEGPVVVTIIPGGATFLTEGKNSSGPSFGNYSLGGAVVGNFNKHVGVEGEVTGAIGISQTLTGFATDTKTPHMLNYTGNVVVSFPTGKGVVPYVTAGAGGMSVFETADLGINQTETFFTSNVGGGLKLVRRHLGTAR